MNDISSKLTSSICFFPNLPNSPHCFSANATDLNEIVDKILKNQASNSSNTINIFNFDCNSSTLHAKTSHNDSAVEKLARLKLQDREDLAKGMEKNGELANSVGLICGLVACVCCCIQDDPKKHR